MADNPFAPFESAFSDMMKAYMPQQDAGALATGLMEAYAKNVEALAKANAATIGGAQEMMQRHMEMLRSSFAEFQESAADMAGTGAANPMEAAQRHAERVEAAFKKAAEDLREIAEIGQRAQAGASEVIKARMEESAAEFQAVLKAGPMGGK